ncbi:SAM-dependent methyltransferase [Alicyclobacillus contaminans]|uniref:class I SAM-dependent rRNA methyltransferase n=1 Tax=Alicyclobacillus contaminans TaxID=392016 RepID=UPI00047C3EA4|nr:SAM-dependent methyltransferase [Alicyclobacillus contaminans]
MTVRLYLKKSRKKRLEHGHPWVYQSEVEGVEGTLTPGCTVEIVNHQGVFLARGYANPQSQIIARVLTYSPSEAVDENLFFTRIRAAWEYRQQFLQDTGACRAIYGEADFLPGLIVDKYNDILVVQILSYGMEVRKDWILQALKDVLQPRGIYLRNDVPVRRLEGLSLEADVWFGDVPDEVEILENGLRIVVNVREGQKTGYFFDQRDNRAAIAPLMRCGANQQGARVLECFCHTGGFTVHALHYGAAHVTAVDISEPAIDVARRNAALNGFNNVEFVVANAFDYLREAERNGQRYDVVILDPPAFAKSRRALEGAIRGYKEINLRGMKLLRDGGFLVTASCSYHMLPDLFQETLLDAALDAHKILRLVHWSGAGKDHPEIAGVPEGHYLKFAIFQVHSRG